MQLLTKLPKTIFNVMFVRSRGKRRLPRLLLLLGLLALLYMVGDQAVCVFNPSSCGSRTVDTAGHVPRESSRLKSDSVLDKSKNLPNSLAGRVALLDPPADTIDHREPVIDGLQPGNNLLELENDPPQLDIPDPPQSENIDLNKKDESVPSSSHEQGPGENKIIKSQPDAIHPDDGDSNKNGVNPSENKEKDNPVKERDILPSTQTTTAANNTTKTNSTEADVYDEKEEELGEEGERMSPEEVAEAIRTGAMCKTVCPPFRWSKWSPCSKACGRGRRYRKAIYDFLCSSSNFCLANKVEESVCDIPCKFDPDKYGGPDGLDLYPVNPLNPIIYLDKYGCGNWLVEYEKIHKDIVAGRRTPKFLVYSTGKGDYPTAGGISGRIKGITTVFFMAVLLERAFVIEWEDPSGLADFLEPKSFDWANLSPIHGKKRGPIRDIASWKAAKDDGHSSQWYMNTNFTRYFKYPVERIQGARYDFTYALLRNPELMPKAYEYGIDRIKCRLCCAWDMLFKMTPKFEEEMNKILKSIGYPSKPLLALQVRAKSDNIENAVNVAEHNMNCAQKASKDLKLKPVYVPVFNNRLVVHIIAKKYKRLMKTPIEIETATRTVHTHLGNLPSDTELEVAKGVQERTFKEFFLLLNSTVLIRTKGYLSSMGNVADAIRRHYAITNKKQHVYTYTAGGSTCALMEEETKIE